MKKLSIKSFIPSASLVASFLIAAVASYLLVAHFQHTILQAWFQASPESSQNVTGDELSSTSTYVTQQEVDPDVACGCPLCCGVIN